LTSVFVIPDIKSTLYALENVDNYGFATDKMKVKVTLLAQG
jgi:hypothetical protein